MEMDISVSGPFAFREFRVSWAGYGDGIKMGMEIGGGVWRSAATSFAAC